MLKLTFRYRIFSESLDEEECARYFWANKSQVMKSLKNSFPNKVKLGTNLSKSLACSHALSFLKNKIFFGTFLFFTLFSYKSLAQELQGKFQDWNVFKTDRGDKIICYTVSTPIRRDGNYDKRGEPFFLVTNIENDADEISTSAGFIFREKSNVEVSFGSKKFYLFPYKAIAWSNNKNEDIDIIKEMQKSADMVLSSVDKNGKIAIDTYSLIGFSQSYEMLKKACKN